MVQAAACRAVLYGFNSHPQLQYRILVLKWHYRFLVAFEETGNYNLLKALQRTEKIYDTKRRCRCDNMRPEDLRRKGRVFIHRVCWGWYPHDLGVHLKKQSQKSKPKHHRLVATARSYWINEHLRFSLLLELNFNPKPKTSLTPLSPTLLLTFSLKKQE